MNRSLGPVIIDLIHDGVPPRDLKARGDRAVYNALLRTAASAVQHGIPRHEWQAYLEDPRRALGRQAQLRKGKPRPQRDYLKLLDTAWSRAEKWVVQAPAPIDSDDAVRHAKAVRDLIADPDLPIDDVARAILAVAANVAIEKRTDRPALPRRTIVERTGLGERTVRDFLTRLDREGLLVLAERGRSSGDAARRRASLYRLPDAAALKSRLTSHRPVGTSHSDEAGTSHRPVRDVPQTGFPGTGMRIGGATSMATLTVKAETPEALAAAVHLLGARAEVEVTLADPIDPVDNVVDLRRAPRRAQKSRLA